MDGLGCLIWLLAAMIGCVGARRWVDDLRLEFRIWVSVFSLLLLVDND